MKHELEYINPLDLIPYAKNSRTHSDDQISEIAKSITEFGFTNPVLIDTDSGVIAGHGRVIAAIQIGIEAVPCIRLGHLTSAQKRAYIIADNKIALNAGWDFDVLRAELIELGEMDFDVSLLGFGEDELSGLLDGAEEHKDTPESFQEYDENIPVEHKCPMCAYVWSGSSS